MSIRVATSSLISGAVVVGDPGLGVLGSDVPTMGEHGGGIAATWLATEDLTKEVRVLITSWPATGTLFVYEDTSFEYDGESTTFEAQLYLDGVAVGSPQLVTLTIGGGEVTLTISDAEHAQDATAVALTAGLALTVADALHAQQAGSPTLTAAHTLNVAASLHAHTADQLPVSAALTLAVAGALHAQSAERQQLTYPGLFAQDDFFGSAAGTELSAHNAQWVRASGIGSHQLFINAAELLYITGVTSGNGTYYIGASPGSSDYEVSTNVVFLGPLSTSGPSLGVIGRFLTASPNTFYFAMYQSSTDTWRLTKFVSGTATLLGAVAAGAVAGTSRRLSLRMLGSSLSVLVDGVAVITTTDTSITSAGAAGVRFNPFAAPDVIALDNFAAHTLSGVAADLSTNNALHAHTAQTPTLGSTHTVVTSSATHGQVAEAATLSAAHSLIASNAAHAHAAGSPTLTAETAGDVHWANVLLLAHMDGANDSTTFLDSSSTPVTLTRGGSTLPLIKTNQAQFGGASGYFSGAGFLQASGTTRWNLGTGDFTLEGWIRPATVAGVQVLWARQSNASSSALAFQLRLNGNKLESVLRGGSTTAFTTTGATSLLANTWYYVALTRVSGTVRLFVNGVLDATTTGVTAVLDDSTYFPHVGALKSGSLAPSNYFTGHIDELRLTGGVGRYTDTYSVPTAAFPESGPAAPTLAPADAVHAHLAESLALSAAHSLSVASAQHSHSASTVALSAVLNLLVDAVAHAHTAGNLALSTANAAQLSTQDAAHAQTAGQLALSTALTLVAQSAAHVHSADVATLSANLGLSISGSAHTHAADNVSAVSGISLTVQNAFHAHVADGLTLDTALSLAIHDALLSHHADALTLTTLVNLLVDDAIHAHQAGNPTLYLPVPAAEVLRRSVFVRLTELRATVRVDDERAFLRVDDPAYFTRH